MLIVVGDQVIEREAIMRGDEINTINRQFTCGLIDVCTTGDDIGYPAHETFPFDVTTITFHKAAHDIPVMPVPLAPAIAREETHFVESGCVPCLSNHFGIDERVGQFNLPDHGWVDHRCTIFVSAENDSFIEAESIDMHLVHPEI